MSSRNGLLRGAALFNRYKSPRHPPHFSTGDYTYDFLEYHQKRAGYRGMRGPVKEAITELNYDQFARAILQQAVAREENDVTK